MTSKISINNDILADQGETLQQLVYELKINATVQQSLIRFWNLFSKNYSGQISRTSFTKYVEVVLIFLLNVPEGEVVEKLAQDEVGKVATHNDIEFIPFDIFCEFFAGFVFRFVENIDISSFQAFLDLLFERTTKTILHSFTDHTRTELGYDIKVLVYNREQIEGTFTEHQKNICPSNVVYYEEVVVRDQVLLTSKLQDHKTIIEHEILPIEEVIHLGFSAENALNQIVNNRYEVTTQTTFPHLAKNRIKNLNKVKVHIESGNDMMKVLQIACKDSEVIQQIACLGDHISRHTESPEIFNRINGFISHPAAYEILKNTYGAEERLNVLSDFYTVEELEIDQIYKLNKKQQEMNAQRRKLIESESRKRNKKIPIDWEDYCRNLEFNMLMHISNFVDQSKLKVSFRDLKAQNSKDIPATSKHLNLKDFVSSTGVIPTDTLDAYNKDILEYANHRPLQILLLGKPKTGKSKYAKALAKRIDIVHLELSTLLAKMQNRIKEDEENPQTNDEGETIDKKLPWEKQILAEIASGQAISGNNLVDMVNFELQFDQVINKGYILDLPLSSNIVDWVDVIIKGKLKLPKIGCRYFSHVIEFEVTDEDTLLFASGIMEKDEEIIKLYSETEREISRKPKKVPVEGEEEEEESPPEEEEGEEKLPIFDSDCVYRANEEQERLKQDLLTYNTVTRTRIGDFVSHLTKNEHIRIEYNRSNEEELVEFTYQRFGREVNPLRPLAAKLEGGSEKDLLTAGLEEQKLSRRWSAWQQIDPVELSLKGRVISGKSEFACEYAGRVFLFETEDNQNLFEKNARKYLKSPPKLPKTYNIAIVGPRQSGKRTISSKLVEEYGWRLVDVEKMIGQVLEEQRTQEIEVGSHIPSNFEPRVNDVHLSLDEWKEFQKGTALNTKEIWPIILHRLGYGLQKKPENWGIEKNENNDEDEEEAKRLAEEAAKKAKKAPKKKETKEKPKEAGGEDERPKTPAPEDLPLKEIIQLVNGENKLNPVQGVCIIGQPMTEEEVLRLKYHNIPIDKVIVLIDRNEEEEGKTLRKRLGIDFICNVETELKIVNDASALLKEQLGEENVKEISIDGTVEEVYNRVKVAIDPFYIRFDDEAINRYSSDLAEGDDPLTWGEYGPFCPVIFKEDKWLVPGKNEIEVMVRGKRHRFFTEEDKKKFQENTNVFVDGSTHFNVPPPRFMFMGARGCGLHTQLNKLFGKYKIPIFELKKNLLAHIQNEKDIRRQDRLFERGFKPQEVDEEGKLIEDPFIEEESPEFDKRAKEIQITKRIFSQVQEIFINANFFDVEEETVVTPLNELLVESRKLPEIFLHLKVDEKNFMARKFNEAEVKKEYDRLVEERRQIKLKEKEEARQQRLRELAENAEEGAEVVLPEDDEEEAVEEEDPEAPDLAAMITEKKEKLVSAREAESAKVEEYASALAELGVPVIEINCDAPIQQVFDRINHSLVQYLQQRQNLLEKYQTQILKREIPEDPEEEPKQFRLDFFEKSYCYKKSRYQNKNALTLIDVPVIREYPLLYRDRIYYFSNVEEVEKVSKEPLKYLVKPCFPTDVDIKPIVFVIGNPKSGKSTLSKLISEKLGLIRIKLSNILEDYIQTHKNAKSKQVMDVLASGNTLSDQQIVEVVLSRVQQADALQKGWVLDGLPQNRNQATLFQKYNVVPSSVFSVQLNPRQIVERVSKKPNSSLKFGYNEIVLHDKQAQTEVGILENYYQDTFNNIRFVDGTISKWGMFDQAKEFIETSLLAKYHFTRALVTDYPVNISQLGLTRAEILENIGRYNNFSPVSLKTRRLFIQNSIRHPYLAFFDGAIYVLDSQQEMSDFLQRPDLYVYQLAEALTPPSKISLDRIISEYQNVSNKGHCVGSLRSGDLKKSQPSLLVAYKDEVHSFSTPEARVKFIQNPQDFSNIKLQSKLPVEFSPFKLVKKIAKKGDCTAFLEHHLGNIVMRVLAQLGYRRIKYPTLSCKETALKFIAISLKANNPNKDANYRQKYQDQLQLFLKHCSYCGEIREEFRRKEEEQHAKTWSEWDEENLLKVTREFHDFRETLKEEDKEVYFQRFIH